MVTVSLHILRVAKVPLNAMHSEAILLLLLVLPTG